MTSWMQLARVGLVLALSLCAPEGPLYVEPPPALSGDDALWRDVGVGRGYACAVSGQGELRCWGGVEAHARQSLGIQVKSIAGLSYGSVCVIDLQDHVQCVEKRKRDESELPFGSLRVKKVVIMSFYDSMYALSLNGELFQYRANKLVSVWPEARLDDVFRLGAALCGRVAGEGMRCTGDSSELIVDIGYVGDAVDVLYHDGYFCKLTEAGRVVCWSPLLTEPPMPAPSERFKQLVLIAPRGACGLSLAGELKCWGKVPPQPAGLDMIQKISSGDHAGCALRVDGSLNCWGANNAGQANPPGERFVDASIPLFGCGLRADHTLVCWGGYSTVPAVYDDFRWTKMSAGWSLVCAEREDGAVLCWGWNPEDQHLRPLDLDGGPFADFELGGQTRCGLGFNGGVECKGDIPLVFEPSAEAEQLESLSVGAAGVCGVTRSKRAVCWLRSGVKMTLEGEGVTAVSSGADSICLLKGAGEVRCWDVPPEDERGAGQPQPPLSLPPAADKPGWTSLSCGVGCCGLDAARIPHCWGGRGWWSERRQAMLPKEPVEWIRLEGEDPCWLGDDGDLECFKYIIR